MHRATGREGTTKEGRAGVADQEGTTKAGRAGCTEADRVGSTEAVGWVLPKRAGWVLPMWSAVIDSSVTCPKALFRKLRERSFSVSNTINIITYTDL